MRSSWFKYSFLFFFALLCSTADFIYKTYASGVTCARRPEYRFSLWQLKLIDKCLHSAYRIRSTSIPVFIYHFTNKYEVQSAMQYQLAEPLLPACLSFPFPFARIPIRRPDSALSYSLSCNNKRFYDFSSNSWRKPSLALQGIRMQPNVCHADAFKRGSESQSTNRWALRKTCNASVFVCFMVAVERDGRFA